MILTNKDVQDIVALLDASAFDELIVETPRFKLTLRRGGAGWTQEHETRAADASATAATPKPQTQAVELKSGETAVIAPLPGTFYRAPKPGAAPFVELGSKVAPETVVAIVETMKLMTPVHAGAAGTITDIIVANAAFIERDAVLMKIKAQ